MSNIIIDTIKWALKWVAIVLGSLILLFTVYYFISADSFSLYRDVKKTALKCKGSKMTGEAKRREDAIAEIFKLKGTPRLDFLDKYIYGELSFDYFGERMNLRWASESTETGYDKQHHSMKIYTHMYITADYLNVLDRTNLEYTSYYTLDNGNRDVKSYFRYKCETVPFKVVREKAEEFKKALKKKQKI